MKDSKSPIGFIAIFVILISGILCSELDSESSNDPGGGVQSTTSSQQRNLASSTRDNGGVASSTWSFIRYYTDEMTGELSYGAYSSPTGPTRSMGWPYHDVTARIFFSCDAGKNNEAAWIRFSTSPNLVDTDTQSGYDIIKTRIRWDDKAPESATLTQQWTTEDLSFMYDGWAINRLEAHSEMLLELNWYESGRVFFRFDLAGSSAAFENARARCRGE